MADEGRPSQYPANKSHNSIVTREKNRDINSRRVVQMFSEKLVRSRVRSLNALPSPSTCKRDYNQTCSSKSRSIHLRHLDLSNNSLQQVCSETLHQFSRVSSDNTKLALIEALILQNNSLNDSLIISLRHISKECPRLNYLDLSGNGIKHHLSSGTIPRPIVRSLRRLDLSHNALVDLSPILVLEKLEWLNISHNALSCVSLLPTALRYLDISNNKLSRILDLRLLAICSDVRDLSIHGNPLCPSLDDGISGGKLYWKVKALACSMLPRLEQFNGRTLSKQSLRNKKEKILKRDSDEYDVEYPVDWRGGHDNVPRDEDHSLSFSRLYDTSNDAVNDSRNSAKSPKLCKSPNIKQEQEMADKKRCLEHKLKEDRLAKARREKEKKAEESLRAFQPKPISKAQQNSLISRLSSSKDASDPLRLIFPSNDGSFESNTTNMTIESREMLTDDGNVMDKSDLSNTEIMQSSCESEGNHSVCSDNELIVERFIASMAEQIDWARQLLKKSIDLATWKYSDCNDNPRIVEMLQNINELFDRIEFLSDPSVPEAVEQTAGALSVHANSNEEELLQRYGTVIDNVSALSGVLNSLQVMLQPLQSHSRSRFTLKSFKSKIMMLLMTDQGKYVHSNVLLPSNIDILELLTSHHDVPNDSSSSSHPRLSEPKGNHDGSHGMGNIGHLSDANPFVMPSLTSFDVSSVSHFLGVVREKIATLHGIRHLVDEHASMPFIHIDDQIQDIQMVYDSDKSLAIQDLDCSILPSCEEVESKPAIKSSDSDGHDKPRLSIDAVDSSPMNNKRSSSHNFPSSPTKRLKSTSPRSTQMFTFSNKSEEKS